MVMLVIRSSLISTSVRQWVNSESCPSPSFRGCYKSWMSTILSDQLLVWKVTTLTELYVLISNIRGCKMKILKIHWGFVKSLVLLLYSQFSQVNNCWKMFLSHLIFLILFLNKSYVIVFRNYRVRMKWEK